MGIFGLSRAEKEQAEKGRRALEILDFLSNEGVFIAELDTGLDLRSGYDIKWANKQGKVILEQMSGMQWENFRIDTSQVVGNSIHTYHKDPNRIKQILDGLAPGHSRKNEPIIHSDVTLQTTVHALVGMSGEKVGYVLTAIDDSSRTRIEQWMRPATEKLTSATTVMAELMTQADAAVSQIAQSSQEQASEVQRTQNSVAQMGEAIKQVAEGVGRVAELAGQACLTAEEGAEIVSATVEGMRQIQETISETTSSVRSLGERARRSVRSCRRSPTSPIRQTCWP